MLYQNLISRKIIRVLQFREVTSLERVASLLPEMIRQYQVPTFLRRDVYYFVMCYYFPLLRYDVLEEMLDNAYPQKEIYPKKTKTNPKENLIN